MIQLIYRSLPLGYSAAVVAAILVESRHNNLRDDITGALFVRRDLFVQLVEGPEAQIDALFKRLLADDRHAHVTLLDRSAVRQRKFSDWSMREDPLNSWAWEAPRSAEPVLTGESANVLVQFAGLSRVLARQEG